LKGHPITTGRPCSDIHCAIRSLGQLSHSANSGEDTDSLFYPVDAVSTESASIADKLQVAPLGNNIDICLTSLISFIAGYILRFIVLHACSFCNVGAPADLLFERDVVINTCTKVLAQPYLTLLKVHFAPIGLRKRFRQCLHALTYLT
jgi:hypothetical protein